MGMKRNLDGCYFRVKRNGKWENVCFSDLSPKERDELFLKNDRPASWWQSLAYHLADCLQRIGTELDIECVSEAED